MDEVANFQILGPLGCQGWVVIPQIVKKSQNHCTLLYSCTHWLRPPNSPRPAFGLIYEGAIGQPR